MNMQIISDQAEWFQSGFSPISLEALNGKAAMLSRIDNKYVLDKTSLAAVMPDLTKHFEVLEIDGRRAFTYNTRYFDTSGYSAYYEHHQGLRKGFKVRVRRYVDAGLCYLELKVKGQRGMTEKHRMPYDEADLGGLTAEAKEFVSTIYSGHYGREFNYDLQRALDIQYRRITLVAKQGGERMTIDTDLRFCFAGQKLELGTDRFIVETKSQRGRGFADKSLQGIGSRSTKKCSKYCVGMAALGLVERHNRFLPTMRKLGLVSGSSVLQREALKAA
jgi:hypothetical protein